MEGQLALHSGLPSFADDVREHTVHIHRFSHSIKRGNCNEQIHYDTGHGDDPRRVGTRAARDADWASRPQLAEWYAKYMVHEQSDEELPQ